MYSQSGPLLRYGTLLASLTSFGLIIGLWGCKMFSNSDIDNCANFYIPGTTFATLFAAITFALLIAMRPDYSDYGFQYAWILPMIAFATMFTTSGLWGCQTCNGNKVVGNVNLSTIYVWFSLLGSSITMIGTAFAIFKSNSF